MFSVTLKNLRQQKGLSQEQLAEALGTSRQTVSKWESGAALPDALNLLSLSDFFGVSTDTLLRGLSEEETSDQEDLENDSAKRGDSPQWKEQPEGLRTFAPSKVEYEYISPKRLWGMPLVHIHIGIGAYRAKGIFSVGMLSSGIVSVGLLSTGVVSAGLLSIGVFAFGMIALGLAAVGGVAAGVLAIAGIAAGLFAIGGISLGMFAIGGIATASHVAIGGFGIAPLVFKTVDGVGYLFTDSGWIPAASAEARTHIFSVFPNFPEWLLTLLQRALE